MLFGNMIFIKKTGGDGSKYPVTQRNIKIGRSEDCLIRIYNPQVAPEHCQLIIDDNGQAKLRNFSYCTILNGKPLNEGVVTLCHGDVFKLGERSVRWEYLPSSKYYKQPLSPTGRLVAVVMPQQRSVEKTPGTSALQVSAPKSTPLGTKRAYSERVSPMASGSANKIPRPSSTKKTHRNLGKFLTGRHSLKGTKAFLQGSRVKQRKSTTGVVSVKTPKAEPLEKQRKSTMPSWKVNIVSPPPTEKAIERRSAARVSTPIVGHEKLVKSVRQSTVKTPLRAIVESPPKEEKESPKSTRSITGSSPPRKTPASSPSKVSVSTPKQMSSLKPVRLIHSEKKLKSSGRSPRSSKELKRMSLVLDRVKAPGMRQIQKLHDSGSQMKVKSPRRSKAEVFDSKVFTRMLPTVNLVDATKVAEPTATQAEVLAVKKTPRKSVKTPKRVSSSPSKGKEVSSDQKKAGSPRRTFPDKNPALNSTPARGRSPSVRSSSSKKPQSPAKEKSSSPRGIRRRFTASISSAERAAKELKTSSPRKPDKNKKAALLLLGKANRKQLLLQNVKVLLKQRIVKKAIKQSSLPPVHADEKMKKVKAAPLKVDSRRKKKMEKKSERKGKGSVTARKSAGSSPKNNRATEETLPTGPRTTSPATPRTSSKAAAAEDKSPAKQSKKSVFSVSTSIKGSPLENSSPGALEKSSESYLFASNRRSSKRLSSKNDTSRPDFMELSPTALGLIPKNVDLFKTPKEKKRRSSSLATPKNARTTGIIKSASTSKIGHRKSVRFSSKDVSMGSVFSAAVITEGFDSFRTPDVTLDLFVSPLTDASKSNLNESTRLTTDEKTKGIHPSRTPKSSSTPRNCVRKLLQSPQPSNSSKTESPEVPKIQTQKKASRPQRSPKNDLTDVAGVRKLFATPKAQKSPKNDLTDVRGVRRLLRTPKFAKSPKNDLTDVRGVKKLLKTPKVQKSPKNDLTDVRGVKQLLRTPRTQKSPKNDLTDVGGVKKLLRTPKVQKSPKNDLSDVRGVKQLLQSPKNQTSPKNDLSDLTGVPQLFRTPRVQKSPRNDLTDVQGVRRLLRTPKEMKSPKNDLTDVRGVKNLLRTPKVEKSPKNDLSDLRGVKRLMQSPKAQRSPVNDLRDVSGVGDLFEVVKEEKSPEAVTGVKQLLIAKSPEVALKSKKSSPRRPRVNDFRAIRGRRTIYASPKVPKNDLSDVTGVRELFARHQPASDFNISLTGVAELFDLPASKVEAASQTAAKPTRKKATGEVKSRDELEKRPTRSRRVAAEKAATAVREQASKKRKPVEESKTKRARGRKATPEPAEEVKSEGRTLKRKAPPSSEGEPSPPKTRRRLAAKKIVTFETRKRSASKSEVESATTETVSAKRTRVTAKTKDTKTSRVQTKATETAAKPGGRSTTKVQKRSQRDSSESEEKSSTRKTRSTRAKVDAAEKKGAKAPTKKAQSSKSVAAKKRLPQMSKKSTRRK